MRERGLISMVQTTNIGSNKIIRIDGGSLGIFCRCGQSIDAKSGGFGALGFILEELRGKRYFFFLL